MDLPGIPDSINWSDVRAFLGDRLGLPLDEIAQPGVRIGVQCIEVDVYALDERGRRYFDYDTETVAMHSIRIPIVHDAERRQEAVDTEPASADASP